MTTEQSKVMNGAEAMAETIRQNLAEIRLIVDLATLQATYCAKVEPREFWEAKAKAIRAARQRQA